MASFEALFPKAPPHDRMNWQETRTDIYRVVPGAEVIGLKLRGAGGLELKALRAAPEDYLWRAGTSVEMVLGRTDQWVKWELAETSGGKLMAGAREVHVKKVRWIRKFSSAGGPLKPVYAHGPGSRPANGCNVERTELTVGQEEWLSLGFEAFGDPARSPAILAEAVTMVMEEATAEEIENLAAACSQSYPVWLDAFVKRAQA